MENLPHTLVGEFLAIEGFAEGVMFLSSRGAEVNAVNEFGDTALVDVAAFGNDLGLSRRQGSLRLTLKPETANRGIDHVGETEWPGVSRIVGAD